MGYDQKQVEVHFADGRATDAWTYVARYEAIDVSLKPFDWYKDYVVRGARQHGLPDTYVACLDQLEAIFDWDAQRAASHRRLLKSVED